MGIFSPTTPPKVDLAFFIVYTPALQMDSDLVMLLKRLWTDAGF
jgi:hypothetical protein